MRLQLALVAAFGMLAAHAGSAFAAECDAPKPALQIAAPTPSLGSAAGFSGVWGGVLTIAGRDSSGRGSSGSSNFLLCMKLHVSVKDGQNASIELCRGSLKERGRLPGCFPFEAKIDGNRLTFGNWTFTQTGPDTLSAQTTSLSRIPLLADFHREH